jgi:hypothetical protein
VPTDINDPRRYCKSKHMAQVVAERVLFTYCHTRGKVVALYVGLTVVMKVSNGVGCACYVAG